MSEEEYLAEREYEKFTCDDGRMPDSYTVHTFTSDRRKSKITISIKETADRIRAKYKERQKEKDTGKV